MRDHGTLCGKRDFADGINIKALQLGDDPGLSGGGVSHKHTSWRQRKIRQIREPRDSKDEKTSTSLSPEFLPLKMEKGTLSQRIWWPSGAEKSPQQTARQEIGRPWSCSCREPDSAKNPKKPVPK